jgi:thiopeptide-type bacteriocin biosynthesis protein
MNVHPVYRLLPRLFLRAPFYSYAAYDLRRMPQVLNDHAFRNAVFLASPQLYGLLERRGFDWALLSEKERHTLRKYYNRMAFRPTPFGSFATFTLLEWGDGDGADLARDDGALLHLLPDEQLRRRRELFTVQDDGAMLLILNPMLYRLGKEYRFIRAVYEGTGSCRFFLDSLSAEPFYTRMFKLFGKGPVPLDRILGWVMREGACGKAEALDHLRFLHSQQILYKPGQGAIMGGGFCAEGQAGFWQTIATVKSPGKATLATLAAELEKDFPPDAGFPDGRYFYAAAERPLISGGPSPEERDALESALLLLQRLSVPAGPPGLKHFTGAFRARFDRQKVPLLLALDPDAGIAYEGMTGVAGAGDVLKDLRFPALEEGAPAMAWTAVHHFLLDRWKGREGDPYAPIELTGTMLDGAGLQVAEETRFPNTSGVLFRPCGDQVILEQTGGPSGPALAARFSAFSAEVASLCREVAALECAANPNILFADIGVFSDLHVDNINRRELIYPYEIPLNVFSALPRNMQLPPGDLLLSVQNGELVLESVRLRKRVVPRLASAYNPQNNELGLFRLLCDLQYQGLQTGLSFDLERFFPGMAFYPRVFTGKVVLSAAKWRFGATDLSLLREGKDLAGLSGLERFRRKYRLPRRVSFGHYDQQLVFDLAERSESAFFLECVKGLDKLALTEYMLPGREVRAGYRPLAGQYLGFIHHERPVFRPLAAGRWKNNVKVIRDFPPGSNWLYLKVYCTPLTADRILSEVLRPVLDKFRQALDGWFFIRYTDPGYHLRLRFHVAGADGGGLLAALCRQLEKSGNDRLVHALQGDTYQRELERYAPALIGAAEKVFWRGSELVLEKYALGISEFGLGFATALQMVLGVMNAADAEGFAAVQAERFLAEFKADKGFRLSLDKKIRVLQPEINAVVFKKGDTGLENLLAALREMGLAEEGMGGRWQLLADLVHMQLNRTFRTDQRKQELIVWYCTAKHLCSLNARAKKAARPSGY